MTARIAFAACIATALCGATESASRPAAPEDAAMRAATTELVLEAADRFREIGLKIARDEFNDPNSERWLRAPHHQHLFAMTRAGVVWADNVFPGLVGLDFSNIVDAYGVAFGRRIIDETPDERVFVVEIAFDHPNGGLAPGVGSCVRPDAMNILCVWAEGAPQARDDAPSLETSQTLD